MRHHKQVLLVFTLMIVIAMAPGCAGGDEAREGTPSASANQVQVTEMEFQISIPASMPAGHLRSLLPGGKP